MISRQDRLKAINHTRVEDQEDTMEADTIKEATIREDTKEVLLRASRAIGSNEEH